MSPLLLPKRELIIYRVYVVVSGQLTIQILVRKLTDNCIETEGYTVQCKIV